MKAIYSFLSVLALFSLLSISGLVLAQSTPTDQPSTGEISPDISKLVDNVRQTTAGFRDFASIADAGYGKFLDCFVNNQIGGMGQHYVNGDLAGDDQLDPMKPEVLVYEPTEDGDMILVALEYIVFANAWDPDNTGRTAPVLFDQPFHLETEIPDTPPVWSLHLWLYTDNPEGLFADFNPLVSCAADQPITDMTPKGSSEAEFKQPNSARLGNAQRSKDRASPPPPPPPHDIYTLCCPGSHFPVATVTLRKSMPSLTTIPGAQTAQAKKRRPAPPPPPPTPLPGESTTSGHHPEIDLLSW